MGTRPTWRKTDENQAGGDCPLCRRDTPRRKKVRIPNLPQLDRAPLILEGKVNVILSIEKLEAGF